MAVSVDVEALLVAAGRRAADLGREHVARGRVTGLTAVDGGIRATVTDREGNRSNVSVAIVGRALVDDCDRDSRPGGGLCEHAVAVVLAARQARITWTSSADPTAGRSDLGEPGRTVAEAAAELTRTELVRLVAAHAATDRLFAAKVLKRAGRLAPAGPAELAHLRRLVREAAAVPNGHQRWDLHDLVTAGIAIVAELEILTVRPATTELLDVIENAIGVWDTLAGHLLEDWENYETEPAEIGEALADFHQEVCDELRPDPVPLGRRLAELVESADIESYLDAPDGYAHILGAEGLAAYETARNH